MAGEEGASEEEATGAYMGEEGASEEEATGAYMGEEGATEELTEASLCCFLTFVI